MEISPITEDDSCEYMNKLLQLLTHATMRFRLSSVVVSRNRVIGSGVNSKKTHPQFGVPPYYCLHAETAAIWDTMKKGNEP